MIDNWIQFGEIVSKIVSCLQFVYIISETDLCFCDSKLYILLHIHDQIIIICSFRLQNNFSLLMSLNILDNVDDLVIAGFKVFDY